MKAGFHAPRVELAQPLGEFQLRRCEGVLDRARPACAYGAANGLGELAHLARCPGYCGGKPAPAQARHVAVVARLERRVLEGVEEEQTGYVLSASAAP